MFTAAFSMCLQKVATFNQMKEETGYKMRGRVEYQAYDDFEG